MPAAASWRLGQEDFLEDKRTQQAVIMRPHHHRGGRHEGDGSLCQDRPGAGQVPWRNMRGMRNRIAHGYFDINLDVVWDTVQAALPELLKQLPPCVRMLTTKTATTMGWNHDGIMKAISERLEQREKQGLVIACIADIFSA
jgi:hypothetical protein